MRRTAAFLARISLPALRRLEPERAHHLALSALRLLPRERATTLPRTGAGVSVLGLHFANPVGLAAGFDKDGDSLDALGALGFSHIEVGTVTPRAQPGNPRPRLFRIDGARALVNRMGFNNKGAEHLLASLQRSRYTGVRGVSIGKNADTPIERAVDDYVACFRTLQPVADYFAINVSSPNTERLRELQSADALAHIVASLQDERERLSTSTGRRAAILVKIAPDLTADRITTLAGELRRMRVDGIIATNTTVDTAGVLGVRPEHLGGGLSGAPLHARSLTVIRQLRHALGAQFPIIGVGGITDAAAARASLAAGANLVQLYTGLIYRGPALLADILR